MKIIWIKFVLIFCFVSPALAGGFLPAQKISKVGFHTTGFFIYADGWSNPNSCSDNNAIVLLSTDPNYDKAYSLLLVAYTSGRKVLGYSDGCTTFDGRTYNTIRGYKYLIVE